MGEVAKWAGTISYKKKKTITAWQIDYLMPFSYIKMFGAVSHVSDNTWELEDTYVQLLSFLHKEGFSIISQLHMEIHRLPVDLYVNLKELQRIHVKHNLNIEATSRCSFKLSIKLHAITYRMICAFIIIQHHDSK